jgi:hypothetical protein
MPGIYKKVFNTTVDNSVENYGHISLSDSSENGSAFCTASGAGNYGNFPGGNL